MVCYSWGPGDLCLTSGACYYATIVPQVITAIQTGASYGRDGRGIIYTFSAGNEGALGGTTAMTHCNKLHEVCHASYNDSCMMDGGAPIGD